MNLCYPQQADGMYILNRNSIEEIASNVLKKYFPMNLEYPVALKTEVFLDNLGLMVKYKYLGIPEHEILGATIMGDSEELVGCDLMMEPIVLEEDFGTVLIHTKLCSVKNAPRRRYTETHEAAHWLLHRPYFDRLPQDGRSRHIACRSIESYRRVKKTSTDWLEWQADSLAAALLMPQSIFYEFVRSSIRNAGARRDYLVEGNTYDRSVFYEVIGPISERFSVSQRAAQIRMVHLGLIKTSYAY